MKLAIYLVWEGGIAGPVYNRHRKVVGYKAYNKFFKAVALRLPDDPAERDAIIGFNQSVNQPGNKPKAAIVGETRTGTKLALSSVDLTQFVKLDSVDLSKVVKKDLRDEWIKAARASIDPSANITDDPASFRGKTLTIRSAFRPITKTAPTPAAAPKKTSATRKASPTKKGKPSGKKVASYSKIAKNIESLVDDVGPLTIAQAADMLGETEVSVEKALKASGQIALKGRQIRSMVTY